MDRIETIIDQLAITLSRLLDPVATALDQLAVAARRHMGMLGIPYESQGTVLVTLAAIAAFIVLRSLPGWIRLLGILFVASLVAKLYGWLPSA